MYRINFNLNKMKNKYLSAFVLAFVGLATSAQVANYTFSQLSGTYSSITDGTVVATTTPENNLDHKVYTVALPFAFTFNGTAYENIHVHSDGYVSFSPEAILGGAYQYKPLTLDSDHQGIIAVFNEDLIGLNNIDGKVGEISYKVEGVAPNREFVIQWKDFTRYNWSGYDNRYDLNFQLRLQETQNVIKKVYDINTVGTPGSRFFSVGLRGTTSVDFAVRKSATGNLLTSTLGATKAETIDLDPAVSPSTQSGVIYTWTPAATTQVCNAVNSFDYNFETNTTESLFTTDCWNGTHTSYPNVSVTNAAGATGNIPLPDKALQVYKDGGVIAPMVFATPEVSTTTGTHVLKFDIELALSGTPMFITGNEKIIVGTLTSKDDFSSFVSTGQEFAVNQTGTFSTTPITFPAGHKHIALKFDLGATGHKAMVVDNIKWEQAPVQEPCAAVANFSFDFENQTNATIFENGCWKGSHTAYPIVSVTNAAGMGGNIPLPDYAMQVYRGSGVNTPITLVAPKVSTTTGTHVLKFDIETALAGSQITGNEKIIVGTLSNNEDLNTFVSTGQEFAVNQVGTFSTTTINFPAGHNYIALKFDLGLSGHKAMVIDNIKWEAPLNVQTLDKNVVKLYPNPVSDFLNIETEEILKNVSVFDNTGKQIISTKEKTIDVQSLSSGLYILQVETTTGAMGSYKFIKN